MSERPKEHASKACVGNTTVGSNPTATAKQLRRTRHRMVGNRVERCEASICGYRMSYLRAGPVDGPALIASAGAAGIVVTDDGSVHAAGNIDAFLLDVPVGAGC